MLPWIKEADENRARTFSVRGRDCVGESQLDEGLSGHADSPRLAIDCTKQIDREVDIHALNLTARARGFRQVKMRAEVFARVVYLIEPGGAQRPTLRGTALLRLRAHGGPR
jgi:hypothetical protein